MSEEPLPPVAVFVAPTGNAFMADIADWIVESVRGLGRDGNIVTDRLPRPDGSVNLVVAPHEFYTLRDDADDDVRAAARCSVPICTEQPGTPWFALSSGLCEGSPLVVDINDVGADALRTEGFDVHRLRLGATPSMAAARTERDVDVVFLGGATPRRGRVLASLAPVLWSRSSEIRTFSFSRPVTGDEPGLVFGADKYELLARARILVNIHRGDADGADSAEYFEWARMVEAMTNGCVVVTEPSIGHEPLVAGEHFIESSADEMASTVESLLDDPARCRAIAEAGREAVTGPLAFSHSVADLLAVVEQLSTEPERVRSRWPRRIGRRTRRVMRDVPPPLLPVFAPYRALRRELYDLTLAEIAHRRELGRFRSLLDHGDPDHISVDTTPAHDRDAATAAEVSVVLTVFDYAAVVEETLDSVVASSDVAVELVIVDDASRDDGADVVRAWMGRHPEVSVKLLARAANQGLTRGRNLGIAHASAPLVMILDADNIVYPTCLRRLADALDAAPDAAFAYSTLEAFGAEPGLRSAQGWHVPWLCDANYIDAQAMLRRSALERLGGYRVDDSMYGWEDWDLWLRIAAEGGRGVHVPQMLGRYRTQAGSMVSLTNLAADDLRAGLVERYPSLPWPESDSP
ncbi:MAG: glycosyltransferase [Ilumatobacter sp.]